MTIKLNKTAKHLVVGGTFDILHVGHKKLISFAVSHARKTTIGLTSDAMAMHTKNHLTFKYAERRMRLLNFLESIGFEKNVTIVEIKDMYGPTLIDKTIDGIVVSQETENGALEINHKRALRGLKELRIYTIPLIKDEAGEKISSSKLRSIKRQKWQNFRLEKVSYLLPDNLREKLGQPYGKITKNPERFLKNEKGQLIAVGDHVSRFLNENGIKIDLAIVDFKINREPVISGIKNLGFTGDGYTIKKCINRPGTIDKSLIIELENYFLSGSSGTILKVEGEEDLAVIPVGILAPVGSNIIYGLRSKGAVVLKVTPDFKQEMKDLLVLFDKF